MSDAADAVADAAPSDAFEDADAPDALEDARALDSSGDASIADAAQDEQDCTQVCALGTTIGCSTDSSACISQCLQDLAMPTCYAEKKAAQLCVIAAGPDAVTCMMGVTFVKTGYCQSEKAALTSCLRGIPVDAGGD
jgi:hypothetical protein